MKNKDIEKVFTNLKEKGIDLGSPIIVKKTGMEEIVYRIIVGYKEIYIITKNNRFLLSDLDCHFSLPAQMIA